MSDFLQLLEAKGQEIIENTENIFSSPLRFQFPLADFVSLASQVSESSENVNLRVGFCHCFARYIIENIHNIKNTETSEVLWDIIIGFAQIVTFPFEINFICDSAACLSLCINSVHPKMLDYIASTESNSQIKPFLLSALIEFLPQQFIIDNRNYLISTLPPAFESSTASQKNNFIQIISMMNFTAGELHANETICSCIWEYVIAVVLSDSLNEDDYTMLSNILCVFQKKNPEFFDIENPLISEQLGKVDTFEDKNSQLDFLTKMLLLVPFMNPQMLHYVMKRLFHLTVSYFDNFKRVPPLRKYTKYLANDLANRRGSPIVDSIQEYLLTKAKVKMYHNCTLFLLSLFIEMFDEPDLIIKRHIKPGLLIIIKQNADCFDLVLHTVMYTAKESTAYGDNLKSDIVPYLISNLGKLDRITKDILKTLKKLIKNNLNVDSYLYPITQALPSIPLPLLEDYFKVIDETINNCSDIELSVLIKFLEDTMITKDKPINVRGYAMLSLDYCCIRCEDILKTHIEESLEIIDELLGSEDIYLSTISIDYMCDLLLDTEEMSERMKYKERVLIYYRRLIDLINDDRTNDKTRRTAALTVLTLGQNFYGKGNTIQPDLLFPLELAEKFVVCDNNSLVSCGILIFRKNIKYYPYDKVITSFQIVSKKAALVKRSALMNDVLLFGNSLIKVKKIIPNAVNDFIASVFTGRLVLFDAIQPYDYVSHNFKLYKVIDTLTDINFFDYIPAVISWFPHIDDSFYEEACEPIFSFLCKGSIDQDAIKIYWDHFLSTLSNCLFSDGVSYILQIILVIYEKGIEYLDPDPFINILYDMWDDGNDNIQELLVDSLILIIAHSNKEVEIRIDIFGSIWRILSSFELELDYERICCNVIALFYGRMEEYHMEMDVCNFFAAVATQKEEDNELLAEIPKEEIVECLGLFAVNTPALAKEVLRRFEENDKVDEQVDKLRQIFTQAN